MTNSIRRSLVAAIVLGLLTTGSTRAQDEHPPEGAIVTGTPAPRTGEWKEKHLRHPDGFWIHYYELGSKGPPVVLLHGLGSTGFANWINVGIATALAETNHVYVPDMRYAGRPAGSPAFPTQAGRDNNSNATDALFFMDALKIDKAHIGGYSMGGGTTAFLMLRAPERFITAHFGGSGPRETDEFIGMVIPDPRPPVDPSAPARGGRGGRGDGNQGTANGAATALYRGGGPPMTYTGDLSKIDFPVLSVTGEFDAPNYVTHRFYRELKDFHRLVLPGQQHVGAVRDPKYGEVLRGFITSNNPK